MFKWDILIHSDFRLFYSPEVRLMTETTKAQFLKNDSIIIFSGFTFNLESTFKTEYFFIFAQIRT